MVKYDNFIYLKNSFSCNFISFRVLGSTTHKLLMLSLKLLRLRMNLSQSVTI